LSITAPHQTPKVKIDRPNRFNSILTCDIACHPNQYPHNNPPRVHVQPTTDKLQTSSNARWKHVFVSNGFGERKNAIRRASLQVASTIVDCYSLAQLPEGEISFVTQHVIVGSTFDLFQLTRIYRKAIETLEQPLRDSQHVNDFSNFRNRHNLSSLASHEVHFQSKSHISFLIRLEGWTCPCTDGKKHALMFLLHSQRFSRSALP
jgi:hypothetical protein